MIKPIFFRYTLSWLAHRVSFPLLLVVLGIVSTFPATAEPHFSDPISFPVDPGSSLTNPGVPFASKYINAMMPIDVDSDPMTDLVVVGLQPNMAAVLRGSNQGKPLHTATAALMSRFFDDLPLHPYYYRDVTAVNFNEDSFPDLALVDWSAHVVKIMVYLPSREYHFETQYSVGNHPNAIASGDFDGDGLSDLVTANMGDNSVSVLMNNNESTFRSAVSYGVGRNPASVTVADFNGDGKPDLATVNSLGNSVSVLIGHGDGTFEPKVDYPVGVKPYSIVAGDFNKDQKIDLAVANAGGDTISVLLGQEGGLFLPAQTYIAGTHPVSLVAADLDHDGNLDLATANEYDSSVSVLAGAGDGTFAPKINFLVGTGPVQIKTGDFNGDGVADLITLNIGSYDLTVLEGIRAGDVTGDGVVDQKDVAAMLQVYLGLRDPNAAEVKTSDLRPKPGMQGKPYGDQKILGDDLNWLLRFVLKKAP